MSYDKATVLFLPPPSSEYFLESGEGASPRIPTSEEPTVAETLARSIELGRIAAASPEIPLSAGPSAQMMEIAAAEAAQVRAQAYREGHEAGMKAGQDEWRGRGERLSSIADGIERAQAETAMRTAEEAVAIAFEAVTKILGNTALARLAIVEVVEQIRDASPGMEPLTVRVGPDDYEVLLGEPSLIELEDQRGFIRLVEDPRVLLGGCIVESSRGTLDARLETQIQRLKSVLLDAHKANVAQSGQLP